MFRLVVFLAVVIWNVTKLLCYNEKRCVTPQGFETLVVTQDPKPQQERNAPCHNRREALRDDQECGTSAIMQRSPVTTGDKHCSTSKYMER